jgi:hypothetical protein
MDKLIDNTDLQIIEQLRKNSRITMKELGEKVFLTGQATKNRVERLQDLGIVERYTINTNCPAFGYNVHALFHVDIDFGKRSELVKFIKKASSHILHCYLSDSNTKMHIDAHFKSIEETEEFKAYLARFGTCHTHIINKEIRGTHPADE